MASLRRSCFLGIVCFFGFVVIFIFLFFSPFSVVGERGLCRPQMRLFDRCLGCCCCCVIVFVEFSPCTHSICELHCDSTRLARKPFVSALVGVWCTLLCVGTGLLGFDCFVYLGIRLLVMLVRPMRGVGK